MGRHLASRTMGREIIVAVFALALCGCPYRGGSLLAGAKAGLASRRVECLDVQVARTPGTPVTLQYRIGNRCLGPQRVDLAHVRVRGAYGDELVDLQVRDPRGELRPGALDGRSELFEEISYETPDPEPATVCVSLEHVIDHAESEPLCLRSPR